MSLFSGKWHEICGNPRKNSHFMMAITAFHRLYKSKTVILQRFCTVADFLRSDSQRVRLQKIRHRAFRCESSPHRPTLGLAIATERAAEYVKRVVAMRARQLPPAVARPSARVSARQTTTPLRLPS